MVTFRYELKGRKGEHGLYCSDCLRMHTDSVLYQLCELGKVSYPLSAPFSNRQVLITIVNVSQGGNEIMPVMHFARCLASPL